MWDAIAKANPGRRMLLIFHQRRMREIEQYHPSYLPWIEQLRKERALFATPPGSNDDWYWLYACVRAQVRGGGGGVWGRGFEGAGGGLGA
jgi:proteinaceous RNase P